MLNRSSNNNINKDYLYLKIYNDIKESIHNGTLVNDDKLPTENELAKKYNVSRITSKRATDLLADNGYIIKIAGKGSFVKHVPAAAEVLNPLDINKPKTKLIGVLLEDITDSYGADIIRGIEGACYKNGYSMVIKFIRGDSIRETKNIDSLIELQVDGLIAMVACFESYNQRILQLSLQNFPMIFVDRYLPGLNIPCVTTNHKAACKELTDAMFNRGHKQIALAFCDKSQNMTSVKERIEGYEQSCISNHSLFTRKHLIIPGDDMLSVPESEFDLRMKQVIEYVLDYPELTAIVTFSSGITDLICRVAQRLKSDYNRKIEVAGFDVLYKHNPSDLSPVYTVHQDQIGIGHKAFEVLKEQIDGKTPPQNNYVPHDLIKDKNLK